MAAIPAMAVLVIAAAEAAAVRDRAVPRAPAVLQALAADPAAAVKSAADTFPDWEGVFLREKDTC